MFVSLSSRTAHVWMRATCECLSYQHIRCPRVTSGIQRCPCQSGHVLCGWSDLLLETVDLDLVLVEAQSSSFVHEKLANDFALIALKLNHFA